MWSPFDWMSNEERTVILLQGGILFTVLVLSALALWRAIRRGRSLALPARDVSKGHRWCPIKAFSNTAYCSECAALVIDGYFCDSCGVCADLTCYRTVDKTICCKALATVGGSMKHHWVKGNLPHTCPCDVCQAECDSEAGLTDFRCCWCHRTAHKSCLSNMSETCDFGRYRSYLVPPFCVSLKKAGIKGRRHLVVDQVTPPPYRPWSPLIVIGNRKSGGSEGEKVLRAFRSFLNPAQVIDLHDIPPEKALQWCKLITDQVCRILVAGGDGTVSWVLNAIEKLRIEPIPEVCILPLGTGNDLSRVLGWGHCHSGEVEVRTILDQISSATVSRLDRWKIRISPTRHLPITHHTKEYFMNNYASLGVDALVALNFHKTRESKFYLFGGRIMNKFYYLLYGAKDIIDRGCENLHEKMELYVDGEKVDLPALEAVVVLNIPSWGGGVKPWRPSPLQNFSDQSYNDGRLEVMGVYSSFHIGQMQVGLRDPVYLGQGRDIKIRLFGRVPIQIDGEPWEQPPAEIEITYHNQATMLCNSR